MWVANIARIYIHMALKKIDGRVIDMAKQRIIDGLEISCEDNSKVFARLEIWDTLQNFFASVLQDDIGISEAFEAAVGQAADKHGLAKDATKALVRNPTVPAPLGNIVVKMADKAVCGAIRSEVSAAASSPPSTSSISPST